MINNLHLCGVLHLVQINHIKGCLMLGISIGFISIQTQKSKIMHHFANTLEWVCENFVSKIWSGSDLKICILSTAKFWAREVRKQTSIECQCWKVFWMFVLICCFCPHVAKWGSHRCSYLFWQFSVLFWLKFASQISLKTLAILRQTGKLQILSSLIFWTKHSPKFIVF